MAFIPVKSYYDGIVDLVPGSCSMMNAVSTLAKTSYVKDRWGRGFERDVSTAMDRMGDQILPEANWSSSVMILTRLGDMGGVILAGWPVYKHHYNKNKHKVRSHNGKNIRRYI